MAEPNVLVVAGHDPSGGAGIQADIEAIAAQGGHALSLITCLTAQDTHNVRRVQPVAPLLLAEQAELLLADCPVAAVKIGLIGDLSQLPWLVELLRQLAVPVVLDPILRAGGGAELVGRSLAAGLREQLLPLTTVLLPNAAEARRLSGCEELDQAGAALLALGAANVIITGGDEPEAEAVNRWYRPGAPKTEFRWLRLSGRYHGAGCTLASALAARLALGEPLPQALESAQAYTHRCLRAARAVGQGRLIPRRIKGEA